MTRKMLMVPAFEIGSKILRGEQRKLSYVKVYYC
jgi:hypothetical protein